MGKLHTWQWAGLIAAGLVVLIVAILAPADWNHLRRPISGILSARLDRAVHISGNLRVHLFTLNPRLSVEGLELGAAPQAKSGARAVLDRLDAQVRLLPPRTFQMHVASRDTHIDARGRVANPFAIASYQGLVTMSGDDLADLYYLTGLAIPNTPPYKFSAVVHGVGRKLFLHDLHGQMGESDLHGNVALDFTPPRHRLEADLASGSLDLVDLAPAFGAPGDRTRHPPRLFPDAELQVDRMRLMDGELRYRADSIRTRKLPLREFAVQMRLDNGVLIADPVTFTLPQGRITGSVRLDATGDVPKTQLDARVTGVKLDQFHSRSSKEPPVEGVLRGRVRLAGAGSSVHGFVSNADGNVTAILPHGEIREALAELTGINVARGLGLLITKDQGETGVRCGVADFEMRKGTLHAKNIVFDTDNMLINGSGKIDLEQETYDLSIQGHPKKLRLLRVKAPILVRGPLRKPKVGLESGDVLKQTGIAVVVAAITAPLAAVLAFVDPGLADDADCSALLAEAKGKGVGVKTAEIAKANQR